MRHGSFGLVGITLAGLLLAARGESVLLECERFDERGGWSVESQFYDQMGSSYLLAHGLGRPVADARTSFSVGTAGAYRLFVRTMNWTARWTDRGAAGRFEVLVDGRPVPCVSPASPAFGQGDASWQWQRGGVVTLAAGRHALALHDLTGFDGRCDAVCLTTEENPPPRTQATAVQTNDCDLVVVGGGVAGISAAVSAARLGLRVALVQDRPVLGGNNSSEVRVHLGAYQNLPPYPRLGDVLAEYGPRAGGNARPAANYEDDRKLAVVRAEKNLALFLNTRAVAADVSVRDGARHVDAVEAVDVITGARHRFVAPLVADCTGDGAVGFLAGADFRQGREARAEYGESLAPEKADAMTMGSSVQWYAEKGTESAAFPQEPWMIAFDEQNVRPGLRGDWNWETGLGRDQIAEAERIRDYGLLVVYSNWSYLKNAYSKRADFATASLAWTAHVAGRRESRRLLGDFVLTERHLDDRAVQPDGTCVTTWTIDQHYPWPASHTHFDGEPFQAESRNKRIYPYPIPYRCFYSRNVDNLFMAGRDISVSHVALGTTRLMRTHGMMGEVVGMAAAVCRRRACLPRAVYATHFEDLRALMLRGVGTGAPQPPQDYNCQQSLDPDIKAKYRASRPPEHAATLRMDGSVTLGNDVRFRAAVVEKGWRPAGLRCLSREVAETDGRYTCAFTAEQKNKPVADVKLALAKADDDIALSAFFKARKDDYFEALMMVCELPAARGAGTYAADGKAPVACPGVGKQVQFRAKRLVCAVPGRPGLSFASETPITFVLRGRGDGGLEVRLAPLYHGALKKGESRALAVRVATGDRLAVAREERYRITEGDTWIAWDDVKDIEPGSALDFSSLNFADAPAGKYGWLKNVDGHFEFERRPGKPVRFAGVNFCGTMNYPTHEETDRVVRRLRALGYNSIRLHHHDAGLVKGSSDNLTFNPEQLDRLDYLVAKAIENGLYVTTDLYVSRPVTWRQMGIDREGSPQDVPGGRWLFKLLIAFHEGAYANWKAFATNFLTHVNPYTGRRYADEPGMPLLSMVNEANYRMGWGALVKEPAFRAKWSAWAEAKRRADPGFAGGVDLSEPAKFSWNKLGRLGDTAPAAFLADNEAENFARQLADMRALGAKALFTSVNHLPYYVPDTTMKRRLYGYFDDHLYIDHPRFPRKAWQLPEAYDNLNPLQDPECRLDKHAYMKVEGLPRTLSEFNVCAPNGYRGMNALLSGAFMAGQDVSAYWRFAYSHGIEDMYDRTGKPRCFNIATDPLNCLSERMIHFLYLRGDFQPFARRVTAVLPDCTAATRGEKMPQLFPDWRQTLTWKARVSCALSGEVPKGAVAYDLLKASEGTKPPIDLPDADGLVVDRAAGTLRLATARSCGVSIARGRLAAGTLDVDVREGGFMTTVALAALDAKSVAASGRLLLMHLTDAQSANAVFADATCRLKLQNGTQTTVIRAGEAAVRLRLDDPAACVVYGLDATGRRRERVPTAVEGGWLCFTATVRTERGARMCYEIVRMMPTYETGADVLKMPDGTRIESAADWETKAKPQILRFFEENVYGALPPKPAKLVFEPVESSDDALEGTAKRRQFRIVSTDACGTHAFDVLLYVPKAAKGKLPVFICPNFSGNHSIVDDPAVRLPSCKVYGGVKATEGGRGARPDRIPVRDIVAGGFAIATFCHCNLYVDYGTKGPAPLDESVWGIFPPEKRGPAVALTAWAWGNQRTMDLLETLPEIDATRVAVVGQSRLAKVAVITAAYDSRFKLCCPNDGGCKTLALVPNLKLPHWFAPGLRKWTEIGQSGLSSAETAKLRGEKPPLPFDECSLIGCIAPRRVHFGASSHDIYAPPDLHFAAVRDSAPVWRLYGKTKIPTENRMFNPEPFFGDLSWHCKFGPHSINRTDWRHYIEDARRVFGR